MIFQHPAQELTPTRRVMADIPMATIGEQNYEPDPYLEKQCELILNKNLDLVYADDFFPTCGGYTSLDPRLIDVLRNDRLVLDRPVYQPSNVQPLIRPSKNYVAPTTGSVPSYSAITGGNYQYYIDNDLSQVFFPPNYQIPAVVQPSLYRDPMGAMKPYYDRRPMLERNAALSEYSFDQDQMSFREDIMSRQSSLMDRTDYTKFHSHFSK